MYLARLGLCLSNVCSEACFVTLPGEVSSCWTLVDPVLTGDCACSRELTGSVQKGLFSGGCI